MGPPQFSMWMFVSSFLPFVVSWFLANFWSSWVRSERHAGCICDGPVVIPLAWRVVAIGSCLPSASWQQRLRPCVGLCPLHHAVGVVHVPLAAALRYLPSGDPESPLDTAKAARAYLGLCCLLLLLPSRASVLSCLRVSACLLPPAPPLCLVLPACLVVLCPGWCFWPPLFCGCGLGCWRGLFCFFAWESLSGFPVCWWFRSVFCLFLRLAFVGFAWR